jgi:phytanoyl-CoA dioxygenase PhyH
MGIPLDMTPSAFGELRDSTPDLERNRMDELRRRYADEGYLLLRGLLAPAEVDAAAAQVVDSLAARGFIDSRFQPSERIAARRARVSTFGFEAEDHRFDRVRSIALAGRLSAFYARFFDAPPRAFDYVWLRLMAPGQATPPHCDIVYMGRGTHDFCSTWIPLTPVRLDDGPLMVLERSHRVERLRTGYARMDIDKDGNWRKVKLRHGRLFRGGDYSRHPRKVGSEFGLRWLTSEFACGDVVVFSPFALHGSLDNRSRRFRISVDARYQRAADPIDERWVGEHPIAHSRAE